MSSVHSPSYTLLFPCFFFFFFFFNDTATTEIYTLSLHDALPISRIFGDLLRRLILPRCRWVCSPSGFFVLWTGPLTWRSAGTASMRLTGLAWNSPTRTTPPPLFL